MAKPTLSSLAELDARRICLIKPSALGDVIQTLPLLSILARRFPEAQISWVVNREFVSLLEDHPQLERVIAFDRRSPWYRPSTWAKMAHLLHELHRGKFDLVLDLQGLLRTAVMTAWTRAPVRLGMETTREGARWTCHHLLPNTGRQLPAHERYRRVGEVFSQNQNAASSADQPPRGFIGVPDDHRQWAAQTLEPLGRPVMAIHPGGRWVTKVWPVEKFAQVAAYAANHYGFALVAVGSPAESALGEQLEAQITKHAPAANVLRLSGQTSLKGLAAILGQADVMLSNDSGPMHLANSVDTPVVGLFTCTSPILSGPPGQMHELPATKVSCAASYKKRCPYHGQNHLACMSELSVSRVCAALDRLVARQRIVVSR